MSNQFLHTFYYSSPAGKRSVNFSVSHTAQNGYEVITHSIVNRVQTTTNTRRAVDVADALQMICGMAKSYEKKNYAVQDDKLTPREILADLATAAAATATQPIAALTALVTRAPSHFIGGVEIVPVLL